MLLLCKWGGGGRGDVDNTDETVQSLSIASNLEDIATELINDFHVRRIYICEIFARKKPKNISPDHYEKRRLDHIRYLTTMVEHESRIRIWRHRRIFESAQEMFLEDGIHVNSLGQKRFYRSVR